MNCSPDFVRNVVYPSGRIIVRSPGELIIPCDLTDSGGTLGILVDGHAVIYSSDEGRRVPLRFAAGGEEVGIAGLFASSPLKTQITSCGDKPTVIFVLDRNALLEIIEKDNNGSVLNSLLCLLSDKVAFLNRRIACLSGGSAERRLAVFLRSLPLSSDGKVSIGMSMKALASALDIGRASLYRAFDSLESSSVIERKGGDVVIRDPQKLESICF